MMKSWSRLCFLVLAMSSVSRGQNETAAVSHNEDHEERADPPHLSANTPTPAPLSPDETTNEGNRSTASTPSPQSQTPDPLTAQEVTPTTDGIYYVDRDTYHKTKDDNDSAAAQTTAMADVPGSRKEDGNVDVMTEVSTATASTTSKQVNSGGHSSWGYVILVLIIVVIIVLSVILYLLRRVSRTYSFDLHRPGPVNHLNEPIGIFEQVYLDDLDHPAPKDQMTTDDLSPPPAANGTTLQSGEKGSNGENAPQQQPTANGTETSLTSNTSPSLGGDPVDKTSSPVGSTDLFFDAAGEDQPNENNNNPSVCSSDPFVEINLDDPAWCDQLLTSPEAPSSVLPFSPFSFSSSSSS